MAYNAMGTIYGAGTSGWWNNPFVNQTGGPQGDWNNPYQPTLSGYGNSGTNSTAYKLGRQQASASAPQGGGYGGYGDPFSAAQAAANAANQARSDSISRGYTEMRDLAKQQSNQLTKDAEERANIQQSQISQDMVSRGLSASTAAWAPRAMVNRELDRNRNYIADQRLQNETGVMQGYANFLERQNDIGPGINDALNVGQAYGYGGGYNSGAYFGAPIGGGYGYGGGGGMGGGYGYGFPSVGLRSTGASPAALATRASRRAATVAGRATSGYPASWGGTMPDYAGIAKAGYTTTGDYARTPTYYDSSTGAMRSY